MKDAIKVLASLSAGVGAINVFLLSYPGDLVPQVVLVMLGAVAAGLAATVATMRAE